MHSIWKDYFVNFGSVSEMTYSIKVGGSGGTTIYTGKAYRQPNETNLKVRINKPIADYLANLPRLSDSAFSAFSFPIKFYIIGDCSSLSSLVGNFYAGAGKHYDGQDYNYDEDNVIFDVVSFAYDWSYDRTYNPSVNDYLSRPINGRINPAHPVIATTPNSSETIALYKADGTSLVSASKSRVTTRRDDFEKDITAAGAGSLLLRLQDIASASLIAQASYLTIGGAVRLDLTCKDGATLYYRNPYGGFDSFLCEGVCKRVDTQSSSTFEKDNPDNGQAGNRGVVCYLNEVQPAWVLNTGAMTEAQCKRMPFLLESPCVYLYNAERNEILPVTITDTSVEHKTYKGNGCALCQYTINVKAANAEERR